MIVLAAPAVVPRWVYEGLFPQADEDRLRAVSAAWAEQADGCGADAEQVLSTFSHLADTWSGRDADAAVARGRNIAELLFSTADACLGLSLGAESAAEAIVATKLAINVVLANLAETTQALIVVGSSDPVAYQAAAAQITSIQLAAHAILRAYETALLEHLNGLSFPADIQPRTPGMSGGGSSIVGLFPEDRSVNISELVGEAQHDRQQTNVEPSPASQAALLWLGNHGAILGLSDTWVRPIAADLLTDPSADLADQGLTEYLGAVSGTDAAGFDSSSPGHGSADGFAGSFREGESGHGDRFHHSHRGGGAAPPPGSGVPSSGQGSNSSSSGGSAASGGGGLAHGGSVQGGSAPAGTGSAGALAAPPAPAAPTAPLAPAAPVAPGVAPGSPLPPAAGVQVPGAAPNVNPATPYTGGAAPFGSTQGNAPGIGGTQRGTPIPPAQGAIPGSALPKPEPSQSGPLPPTGDITGDIARGAGLGMLGAAAAAASLTPLLGALHDLRLPIHPNRTLTPPTQFGRSDVPLAPMPVGMGAILQKVLAPGEADAMVTGTVRTLRGLIYSRDQVAHLATPRQLHDALGLGYILMHPNGQTTMAFDPESSSIEVLRANGIRREDLILPLDVDVRRADLPFRPMIRDHARPWQGGGEAPGSTYKHPIDEFEILGETAVSVPHLAEIWRLGADGSEHHVATYNARSGLWSRSSGEVTIPPGRKVDNGLYAIMADGNGYEAVTLSETHSVLVAYGSAAPDLFTACLDGSHRLVVATREIAYMVGVTSLAKWHGARVQVLYRYGDSALLDYADLSRELAQSLGFGQIAQGHWLPLWVPFSELTNITETERSYPLPMRAPRPTDGRLG